MFPVEVHTQTILSPYCPVLQFKQGRGEKLWNRCLTDCFWSSHGIQRANAVFSTWKVIPFLWIPEVKMPDYSGFLLLLFPPKGILLTQRYVSLFTSLHICSLWPEEWYYCKTWNLSFSERDSGQSPCASASLRMPWTSASKTDMLVRPACLHSWVVFGDSMGGVGSGEC